MITVIKVPKLSPTMNSGTVVKWHKTVGDFIASGDLIAEIATDKATVEYHAFDEGFLRHQFVRVNEETKVGDPFIIVSDTLEDPIDFEKFIQKEIPLPAEIQNSVETPSNQSHLNVASKKSLTHTCFAPEPPLTNYVFPYTEHQYPISPAARYHAKKNNLDISDLKGSGPGGRIIIKDLVHAKPLSMVKFGSKKLPDIAPGTFIEKPLSPMQRIVSERLQASKSQIPHFYMRQSVRAIHLTQIISQLKTGCIKLSVNDFIIRAVALALRDHPEINVGYNEENDTIIFFQTIDISIAVALSDGIITPIIRHADYKNVSDISTELKLLAEKARQGKLQPEEYKGGSFSISNLGMTGISEFSAIINPPQAMILAVGAIEDKPYVDSRGLVQPGKEIILNLSIDHRVINGKEAAIFLKTLQKYLENPALLLLN